MFGAEALVLVAMLFKYENNIENFLSGAAQAYTGVDASATTIVLMGLMDQPFPQVRPQWLSLLIQGRSLCLDATGKEAVITRWACFTPMHLMP